MHLIIDIGNTLCKAAIFTDDRLEELWAGSEVNKEAICALVEKYRPVAGIVSTVRKVDDREQPTGSLAGAREDKNAQDDRGLPTELGFLASYGFPVIMAGAHLRLPLTMRYRTPETLGSDRLAAAVAARHMYPNENVLVINAGTCLTTDFVTEKGEYLGGTIAPGMRMRLQALHHYTGNLPLVQYSPEPQDVAGTPDDKARLTGSVAGARNDNIPFPGETTHDAILAGVTQGIAEEINGLIGRYQKKISFFNVILSGGDAKTFDKKLKNRIFAVENIVLHGLNQLLKYNV